MFCPKCGNKTNDGDLVCGICGFSLAEDDAQAQTQYSGAGGEEKTVFQNIPKQPQAHIDLDGTVAAPNLSGAPQNDFDATVRADRPVNYPAPAGTQTVPSGGYSQAPVQPPMPIETKKKEKAPKAPKEPKAKGGKKGVIGKIIALAIVAAIIIAGGIAAAYFMTENAMQGGGLEQELALGNKYLKDMNYEKALLSYENAIELSPGSAEAQYGYAKACAGLLDYEKAEKSYKQAIKLNDMYADAYNGLAELYIQQDKKEEARKLVNEAVGTKKINDATLVEKHRGMNPEAPSTNVDPLNFNSGARYAIALSDKYGGAVYYTHTYDNNIPGEPVAYSEPIVLQNGKNIITAYVVSAYGFTSETATFEYNIEKTDIQLTFADPIIESAVRYALGKNYGEPVYDDEAARITELSIVGNNYTDMTTTFTQTQYFIGGYSGSSYMGSVTNLSDLRYMPFLNTLNLSFQETLDFSTIQGCTYLENLSLINVKLTSVEKIAGFKELKKLCLGWNGLTDISALGSLTNLTHLGVWGNSISDISVVSKLKKLEYLDVSDNKVSDISAVSSLAELREFWAYGNNISSVAPLVNLNKLKVLMISGNPVNNTEDLKKIYPRLTKTDVQII